MELLKQKLTSRKFWIGVSLMLCGVVVMVLGVSSDSDALLEAGKQLFIAGGGAYIGVECIVDVARFVSEAIKSKEQTVKTITANAESSDVVKSVLAPIESNADTVADAVTDVADAATKAAE